MNNAPSMQAERSRDAALSHRPWRECPDCGLFSTIEHPPPGIALCCPRCDAVLITGKRDPLRRGLAWALASACFFLLAVAQPLMTLDLQGGHRAASIAGSAGRLDAQGYWLLAALVALTALAAPALKIGGSILLFLMLRAGAAGAKAARLLAFLRRIDMWILTDVYLIGYLVAATRLRDIGDVSPAAAALGLAGLMLALAAFDAAVDPAALWETIAPSRPVEPAAAWVGCDTCGQVHAEGERRACVRCGEPLFRRKPGSLHRAAALTLAAACLYIPSNLYPVMTVTRLGSTQSYTIFDGLMELAHNGLWPLAVLIFGASIAIPIFKLLAMGTMLLAARGGARRGLGLRTRLYRLIDFIGRWSMVDVFAVSILVALVRFGWIAHVAADAGAVCFAAVVVLTLLAVKSFDPRLMWDACGEARRVPQA